MAQYRDRSSQLFLYRLLWACLVVGLIVWLWMVTQSPVTYPRPKLPKPSPAHQPVPNSAVAVTATLLKPDTNLADPAFKSALLRLDTMWYIIGEYDSMANDLNDLRDIRVARILHTHLKKIDRARRKAWPKLHGEMK